MGRWSRRSEPGGSDMSQTELRRGDRKRRRLRMGLMIAALGLLVIGAMIYPRLRSSPLDDSPLPNPNGYDDLVRAGQSIVGQVPGVRGEYRTASADELRSWVETNREALTLARVGLDRECRVALPPSQGQLQAHMDKIGSLRQLCRLMGAAARLAEFEGNRAESLRNGLDVIKVAQQGTRGGLMIDALTGFACESIGQRTLTGLRT